MKAVILAAGKGTRMQGLCDDLPKPLLPVANRPLLAHTLGQIEAAGITQALLVVGHQARLIRQALGRHCGSVELHYVVQDDPKGTGQAAALAEQFAAGEPFLMLFGDIVTARPHLPELAATYREELPDAVLSVRHVPNPASGGAVCVEDGRVARIAERPKPGEVPTHFINAGIFVLPPQIFDILRRVELSPRGEYELTDALEILVALGRTVRAFALRGFWINVTDGATYLEAQREVLAETAPGLADVPAGIRVDGPVVVGAGCHLEGCSLGPNVCIGQACTIGAGAAIRDAVIMAGATVGARATVDNAVVGLGARVDDGAQVVGEPDRRVVVVGHGRRFSEAPPEPPR